MSRSGQEKSLNLPFERGQRGVLCMGRGENKQTDNGLLRKAGRAGKESLQLKGYSFPANIPAIPVFLLARPSQFEGIQAAKPINSRGHKKVGTTSCFGKLTP